jgi:hypothetical protein
MQLDIQETPNPKPKTLNIKHMDNKLHKYMIILLGIPVGIVVLLAAFYGVFLLLKPIFSWLFDLRYTRHVFSFLVVCSPFAIILGFYYYMIRFQKRQPVHKVAKYISLGLLSLGAVGTLIFWVKTMVDVWPTLRYEVSFPPGVFGVVLSNLFILLIGAIITAAVMPEKKK